MERFVYKHTIGVKQGLELRGSWEEKKISKTFSNYFLVTFARQGRFKTTDYTFIFLKPDEAFRESFNMYNEVLLLFSPYTEFETRTFDFVDKTLQEFDNRLDKVCILLVSKDPKIESKIQKINSDNNDSKIVVPFTYEEILKDDFDKMRIEYKFRKYFYNRDLFALESPLKSEAYFFGRTNVVQAFYDKYSLGEHCGLFGLRKTGKTSVLFALERMIKLRGGNSIYIDCQNTSIHKSEWNELLYIIVKSIKEKYEINDKAISSKEHYCEKTAAEYFEKDLISLNKLLDNKRILIIFDEIEHISFKTASSLQWCDGSNYIDFWQTLRAIYQKDDSLFSFIIAGVNPLCIEQPLVNGFDNPIFSMIKPAYLALFTVEDVKQMVSSIGNYMGLKFEDEIFTNLADDYGGHPFLVRHVCSLINEDIKFERPYQVTKYFYRQKKQEYDTKIENYIELILAILKKWYPEEYDLLELFVSKGNDEFIKVIYNYDRVINHMLGYGILKKDNGNYFITIKAIETYVNNRVKRKGDINTKEGVWKEVTVRRNLLEERLRKIVLMILSTNFGKKKAKERVLEIVEQSRREKLANIDINKIFTDELYLLDLKKVITKDWTCFEKLFNDRTKFEIFIDYINEHRIDAHSKTIAKDDLAILLIAFEWFENIIEDIII